MRSRPRPCGSSARLGGRGASPPRPSPRAATAWARGHGGGGAPSALWGLGAGVVAMGVSPNGLNINDGCGSTAPAALQQRVVEERADIGIALDGDADRAIIAEIG